MIFYGGVQGGMNKLLNFCYNINVTGLVLVLQDVQKYTHSE